MKLFESGPDTVAAESIVDAGHFYYQHLINEGFKPGDEELDFEFYEIPEHEWDVRTLYDESTESVVTFAVMVQEELEDWNGKPYLFSSII
jgi:hypothetical protein